MKKTQDIDVFSAQVFVMIYESLNAISVAKALEVPPSKISRCLGALRHIFDDQLYIRRQYGFEPTPKADRLYPYFQQLLVTAEQIHQIGSPDAPVQRKEFTIHAPAILRSCLFTRLQRELSKQGLLFTFTVKPVPEHANEILQRGESDLVLAFEPAHSDRLESHFIAAGEQLFLVANEHHPLMEHPAERLLDACLDHPFVVMDCPDFNDRIDPLQLYGIDQGRQVNVRGKVSGLAEAADYLRQSDAFTFVATECAASFFKAFPGLRPRRFEPKEFERLHQRTGVPRFYAIGRKEHPVPAPLLDAICHLIRQCVTLPSQESAAASVDADTAEESASCCGLE